MKPPHDPPPYPGLHSTSYLADRPPSYESSCEEFSPPPHQTTAPRATRPTKLVTTRPSNHSNSRSSSHSKTRSTIHSTTHSITQSTTRPSTTSTTRFTIPPTIRRPIRFTFRPNIVVVRAAQVNFTSALILSCFVYFCCGMLFGLVAFILALAGNLASSAGKENEAKKYLKASYISSILGILICVLLVLVFGRRIIDL